MDFRSSGAELAKTTALAIKFRARCRLFQTIGFDNLVSGPCESFPLGLTQ